MPSAIAPEQPVRGKERIALCVAGAFVFALAVGAFPLRHVYLGVVPNFLTAYGTLLISTELLTSIVLAWRAYDTNERRIGTLAAAYAFSAALVLGNVATLPGIAGAPSRFAFQTAPWMWSFWHVGWALILNMYAWRISLVRLNPGHKNLVRKMALAALAALGCAVLAIRADQVLPPLLNPDGSYTAALYVMYAWAVAGDACALVGLLRKPRKLSALDAWTALAVAAAGTDVLLVATSSVRFSFGTYAARGLAAISGLAVLVGIAAEYVRNMRRATSVERHAALAEASPEIVFMTDPAGRFTYVNQRWTEVTGQPQHKALDEGWRAVVHPDDAAATSAAWQRHLAGGTVHECQVRYLASDGSYVWHTTRVIPARDADGRIIGWLGSAANIHAQVTATEAMRRLAFENERLYEQQKNVSNTLQAAFLPPFLPEVDGVSFDAAYRPATRESEVGGDWYDAFPMQDGRVAISVGDVMGHGLAAATAMVRVRETMRAAAVSLDAEPAAVLAFANKALCAAGGGLATAVFAVYDPATRRFGYASGGHPRPMLVRGTNAEPMSGRSGMLFGIESSAAYATNWSVLETGDRVVLYTDGLVEAGHDLAAGERALCEALREHRPLRSTVDELLAPGQRDDVAVLTLEVLRARVSDRSAFGWRFHSEDSSSAGPARASFADYLARRGCDPSLLMTAELVFGELVGNVVRHAPGPIDIDLVWDADRPVLSVRDRGEGMEAPAEGAQLPQDIFAEGGRGLFLIEALVGNPILVLERMGGGTEILVRLPAVTPASPTLTPASGTGR